MRPLLVCLSCLSITACATFPEVDKATRNDVKTAEYPGVVPLESIPAPGEERLDNDSEAKLEGQINGLKRRARKLQDQNPG